MPAVHSFEPVLQHARKLLRCHSQQLVFGLDTMGIDVSILYVFGRAIAWGLAAALALGVGIAVGWGAHNYVANNIDRWMGRASAGTPSPSRQTQTDGADD